MSNFACPQCGVTQVDQDGVGYVAGCCHYPPDHSDFVTVYFGGDVPPARAFFKGAWYKSERSRIEGRAVHPVRWESDRKPG